MNTQTAADTAAQAASTAMNQIQQLVDALKVDLPGISFGYIGNVGVGRSGPFDDRSWRVFLPHPGRVGTYADQVSLGRTSALAGVNLETLAANIRRAYAAQEVR